MIFFRFKIFKRLVVCAAAGGLVMLSGVAAINIYIICYSSPYIYEDAAAVPRRYTAIVPGALVMPSGNLSHVTYDRAVSAAELYRSGKVKKFLLSGDHGRKEYDEVNAMRKFLLKNDARAEDLFMDHAGFDTYSTMVRAGKVFFVKDAVIVTQKFHLYRAIYIARKKGMDACGFAADRRNYLHIRYYKTREIAANIKAFFEVLFDAEPKFLGDAVPITGDSRLSWD